MFATAVAAEIVHPEAQEVSREHAIDMLLFQEDWPDGTPANRVHFEDGTPQLREWSREVGISPYGLRQRERRHIALGGARSRRVSTDDEMVHEVSEDPAAVGYSGLRYLLPFVRSLQSDHR